MTRTLFSFSTDPVNLPDCLVDWNLRVGIVTRVSSLDYFDESIVSAIVPKTVAPTEDDAIAQVLRGFDVSSSTAKNFPKTRSLIRSGARLAIRVFDVKLEQTALIEFKRPEYKPWYSLANLEEESQLVAFQGYRTWHATTPDLIEDEEIVVVPPNATDWRDWWVCELKWDDEIKRRPDLRWHKHQARSFIEGLMAADGQTTLLAS